MLEIKRVPLSEVFPDAANVRTHSDKNLAAIAGSLKQFGQVEPLVVQRRNRRVIGGNGRLEAMRAMGATEVDIVEVDLDDTQATALAIALNRTGELAGWDYQGLGQLLSSLQDADVPLDELGWDAGDLNNLLSADWSAPDKEPLEQASEDHGDHPRTLKLSAEQWAIFDQAAHRVRNNTGDVEATDGRCLELICADYLAGR